MDSPNHPWRSHGYGPLRRSFVQVKFEEIIILHAPYGTTLSMLTLSYLYDLPNHWLSGATPLEAAASIYKAFSRIRDGVVD